MTAWQELLGNFTAVALFISIWSQAQSRLERTARPIRRAVFTGLMIAAALSTMSLAVHLGTGVIFDFRNAIVVLAGFFGGPISAIAVAGAALAYRILLGGDGVLAGSVGILVALVVGLVAHSRWSCEDPRLRILSTLGAITAAITPLTMALLPSALMGGAMRDFAIPIGTLNALVVAASAMAIIQAGLIRNERNLLRSAIDQAPDYFYVKDRESRFVAANRAVASLNGYATPDQMRGKTDHDIAPPDRARMLLAEERDLMATDVPLIDKIEVLVDAQGRERRFVTSKAPLRNRDGLGVGLVGITKDVTAQYRIELDLMRVRSLAEYATREMTDGLAMFDERGVLVFCNAQYQSCFPLTADLRQPGTPLRAILEAVVATGEQLNIGDPPAWIEAVLNSLHSGGEEEVQFSDGRWVHIKTRPTADGSAMVVVSDVSRLKGSEDALLNLTQQLKALASTDSLTGLMNRRAFDQAFPSALRHCERDQEPLSVFMVDVDHFKSFNDLYGHLAGDDALRGIAACLSETATRPGDLVARFGGEEFIVALPGTSQDRAFAVADRFRNAVRRLGIPHANGRQSMVTTSIGIATAAEPGSYTANLIAHADGALYVAKGAGRDRVHGWRPFYPPEDRLAASS